MATLVSKDTSGIFVEGSDEIELPDKRTRAFKKFSLPDAPDGRKRYRVGGQIGPIHYCQDPFSQTEEYKEIDLDVIATPTENWDAACETNGYQVRLWRKRLIDGKWIKYIAQFRRAGKWIAMAPIALLWKNDLGERQVISKTQDVGKPIIDNVSHQVTAKDAFGPGIDFRYNLGADEFFKTVIVNQKADLPTPTIGTTGLRLTLVMSFSWLADSKASNGFAGTVTPRDFTDIDDEDGYDEELDDPDKFSFKDEFLRDTWWVRRPRAWDSYTDEDGKLSPHTIAVDWKLRRKTDEIFALFSIPASVLGHAQVVYPVYMDTAIPEEQVGAITDDARNQGTTWPGTGAYDEDNQNDSIGKENTTYYCRGERFTTVPIPSGVTIDSAKVTMKAANNTPDDGHFHHHCEDVANAATFSSGSHEPGSAVRTDAYGTFDRTAYWSVEVWYELGEMKTAVQELIDGPASGGNWAENNALVVISVHDPGAGEGGIPFYCYTAVTAAKAAKFNCSYTAAPPSYIPQVIMVQ